MYSIFGCSEEGGENGDGKERNEISGGGKRVEIVWPLVCRGLGFVWRVGERPEGNGGTFVDVIRRRGLKVNAGKNKMMVLGGEEVLESEVCVNRIRLEHVLEFKYFGCVLGRIRYR